LNKILMCIYAKVILNSRMKPYWQSGMHNISIIYMFISLIARKNTGYPTREYEYSE
jgi:hypothetical protein